MRILISLILAAAAAAQQPSPRIPNGSLAAQAAGRVGFYTDGTFDAFGYFSFIEGLDLPLFSSQPSERTAHFTFRSEKTGAEPLANDRLIHLIYRPLNGLWTRLHIYYNPIPTGDFAKPQSFEAGQKIATFRTRGLRITLNPSRFFNLTSGMVLESSSDFTVDGRKLNVKDFLEAASLDLSGPSFPSLDSFAEQLSRGDFSAPFGGNLTAASPTPAK